MDADFHKRAIEFSTGRCAARFELVGQTFAEALATGYRWFPTVGGKHVKPTVRDGYLTRAEAVADAQQFKAACALAAREADPS